MSGLTFDQFREVNVARASRWHGPDDDWTGADWSNAMCGEAGETANVVKKLRRQETAKRGSADPDYEVLLGKLADEIGDVFAYLDLLASFYGIDLGQAVARKFNAVSEREGMPERIEVTR